MHYSKHTESLFNRLIYTVLWLLLTFLPLLRAEDTTTIIDDSDPAITALSGQWIHFTGDEYYNKTETLTQDAGAMSMYIFNGAWELFFLIDIAGLNYLTGTGISVFGTQCDPAGGNTTVSTYMIDNGGQSTYTVPSGVVCNQNFVNFFTSPPLANGKHTLVITNLNQNAWYFLDYLQVLSPGSSSTSNVTITASAASSSSASSSTSQSSSTNGSSSKSMNTGVIVGSVLGAAAVVAIVILAFMVYWRKRRQAPRTHEESPLSGTGETALHTIIGTPELKGAIQMKTQTVYTLYPIPPLHLFTRMVARILHGASLLQ